MKYKAEHYFILTILPCANRDKTVNITNTKILIAIIFQLIF